MSERVTEILLDASEQQQVHIRQRERLLLIIAAAFLGVNMLALRLVRGGSLLDWLPLLTWTAAAIGGHLVLNRRLPLRDSLIFPAAMMLSGWGLIAIDRLAPAFADRQALWLILSVDMMCLFAIRPEPLRWLRRYRYLLAIVGFALLIATILLGSNPTGDPLAPQLWLGGGGLFFQPSEVLKLILVAFLASYLAENAPALRAALPSEGDVHRFSPSARILGPIAMMWSLSVLILVWQRDLGTASLFFIVFVLLLYVTSSDMRILGAGLLLTLMGGAAAYLLFDVVSVRVDIWLAPWPYAKTTAYQVVQALIAVAEGGSFGQGIAQGAPGWVPVAHSDFIFAAIAEEWGLLGIITLIVLLALIVMRGLRISVQQAQRPFYALLAVGFTTLIAVQSLMIMGGVLKLLPLTGITLPYVSYGGSSLLVVFAITGLLIRLSAEEV